MNALEFSGVTCRFGSVTAIDDVSLAVAAGSVFGIIGPNGAGKTTLMRLALGLIQPSAGQVRAFGDDSVESPAVRRRMGVLLEHSGLYERLTAAENLEFYGRIFGQPEPERSEKARALLEAAGLEGRRNDLCGTFSKGMKQQLALARALLHSPDILLLDEPTSGLDPVAAAGFRSRLQRFARSGNPEAPRTIVLATHLLHEAEALCDNVAIVRNGRVVVVAPPEQLRATAGKPRLTISVRNLTPAALDALRALPSVTAVALVDGIIQVELAREIDSALAARVLTDNGASVDSVQRISGSFESACLSVLGAA